MVNYGLRLGRGGAVNRRIASASFLRSRLMTAMTVSVALVASVCLMGAVTIAVRNTFVRTLHTMVAVSESRRALDDVRVAAEEETTALVHYEHTRSPADLTNFRNDAFDRGVDAGNLALKNAGVPLAGIALDHARAVHDAWHEYCEQALVTDPSLCLPSGNRDVSPLLKIESTMNAVNADASTVNALLDERMAELSDEMTRRLPFLMCLGAVLTFVLSAASVTAVIMARRFYRERSVARRLTSAFESDVLPQVRAVKLDGFLRQVASDERVGGDWYDVQNLPDGRIFITMGDVIGHGVEAAVNTARLRRTLLGSAIGESNPAAILSRANAEHVRAGGAMTATICAYYDPVTHEFRYASAGLPAPIIRRKSDATFLSYGGPLLGIFEDNIYECHGATLSAGDTVMLYTDGAIEAERDTVDGEARLATAVRRIKGEHAAHELFDELFSERRPQDDVAIFSLSVHPDSGGAG